MKKKKATLTPDQIQCLKNQAFSDNEPGTLLKDFSSLLDFIGPGGIPVSGKNHLIAIKLLPQLNQLMSHPLDVKLKRPQQKSFPHINGLYLLLRASGLTQIAFEKKAAKLMLDNKTKRKSTRTILRLGWMIVMQNVRKGIWMTIAAVH